MFTKEELQGLLLALTRANWNGNEVESVAYLKQKINMELKKLDTPKEPVKKENGKKD